jgi:hypothetical protein
VIGHVQDSACEPDLHCTLASVLGQIQARPAYADRQIG